MALEVFRAVLPRRGAKGRDDQLLLEVMQEGQALHPVGTRVPSQRGCRGTIGCTPDGPATLGVSTRSISEPMLTFPHLRSLVRGFSRALNDAEVRGVLMVVLLFILVATVFYWLVEGWSLLDAAYFSVVTIATVGYGDLTPKTALGKIFTIAYIVCGIGIFVSAVTALAHAALRDLPPPE